MGVVVRFVLGLVLFSFLFKHQQLMSEEKLSLIITNGGGGGGATRQRAVQEFRKLYCE